MTSGESQQPAGVNTMPSELATRIRGCTACDSLPLSAAVTVRPFIKPCSEFDIYTSWKPEHVSLVFIAEAPPGNSDGYFYDPRSHPGYREILRTALFDLLRLEELGELLAFPTISANPTHRRDIEAAAHWLKRHLAQIGLRVASRAAPASPTARRSPSRKTSPCKSAPAAPGADRGPARTPICPTTKSTPR